MLASPVLTVEQEIVLFSLVGTHLPFGPHKEQNMEKLRSALGAQGAQVSRKQLEAVLSSHWNLDLLDSSASRSSSAASSPVLHTSRIVTTPQPERKRSLTGGHALHEKYENKYALVEAGQSRFAGLTDVIYCVLYEAGCACSLQRIYDDCIKLKDRCEVEFSKRLSFTESSFKGNVRRSLYSFRLCEKNEAGEWFLVAEGEERPPRQKKSKTRKRKKARVESSEESTTSSSED